MTDRHRSVLAPRRAADPGARTEAAGPEEAPAVLVARAPERAAGLLARLRERGLDPVAAAVIERAPADDPAALDAARAGLADGTYAWVAITSVNAVDALLGPARDAPGAGAGLGDLVQARPSPGHVAERGQLLPGATRSREPARPETDTPGSSDTPGVAQAAAPDTAPAALPVRWAAVGPATAQALATRGVAVDLVPAVATGAGLAEAFPAAPAHRASAHPAPTAPRVLLPLGDLAADTVRAGLVAKGWAVDVVTAYRTVAHELPAPLRRAYDVVVVASGSAARQVARQLGPQAVVAIGEPSARAATDAGHTVLAVAAHPTDAALADAVTEALAKRKRTP